MNIIMKKLLAIVLSLVVGVTFIPLLGDSVYAEEEDSNPTDVVLDAGADNDGEGAVDEEEPGDEVVVNDDAIPAEGDGAAKEDVKVDEPADMNETDDPADPDIKQMLSDLPEGSDIAPEDLAKLQPLKAILQSSEGVETFAASNPYYSVSVKVSGKTATVKGSIAAAYQNMLIFDGLYVDGGTSSDLVKTINDFSFTTTINMSAYDIGYHTVYYKFRYIDSSGTIQEGWDWTKKIPSKITVKPNYKGKFYYVYSKYFDYFPFNFGKNLSNPYGTSLYMEYKLPKAKKWKRTGAMKANAIKLYTQQGFKIKGLAANKKYYTRIRYGGYITYSTSIGGDGKAYFFGGPVRSTGTIKSGAPRKPAIKSIKVKAVKVKKHKVRHYGYYTGVYLYTEKYYTYKVKVTVKLKKKPGTAGLWINGKFVKGNKKKYTVTLPGSSYSSKKPKGRKFAVNVCSYQSKSYGGLSPLYKTKKKIK